MSHHGCEGMGSEEKWREHVAWSERLRRDKEQEKENKIVELQADNAWLRYVIVECRKLSGQRSKEASMVGRCCKCDGYELLLPEGAYNCRCSPVPDEVEAAGGK